jgi:hypothetical protein
MHRDGRMNHRGTHCKGEILREAVEHLERGKKGTVKKKKGCISAAL